MPEHNEKRIQKELLAILTCDIAQTPEEVFRRCRALEQLSASDAVAVDALPAILRSLVVPVSVDCVLALRVAAAEAAWKVCRRHDLALPFLALALKDEYWGVSRKAAEVLAEMGNVAHKVIPDLANLAERRLDHGPFDYEDLVDTNNGDSLLTVVATALGNCGLGIAHVGAARRILSRIVNCDDAAACAAAQQAVKQLGEMLP